MTERDSQQRTRGGQQGQPWSLRCHPPKLPISDGALLQKKAHTLFFSRNHVIWVYRDGSFRSEVDFSKGSHREQGQGGCSEPRLAAPAEGWAPMLMQTRERSCRQICVAEATAGSSRQPWGPPPAHVCEGCRGGSQSGSLVWVGERRRALPLGRAGWGTRRGLPIGVSRVRLDPQRRPHRGPGPGASATCMWGVTSAGTLPATPGPERRTQPPGDSPTFVRATWAMRFFSRWDTVTLLSAKR